MDQLPDGLLPSVLIDRKQISDEVTRYFYPLTERKTRELPLNWCYISGRACAPRSEVFAVATAIRAEATHESTRNTERARIAARTRGKDTQKAPTERGRAA